MRVHEYCIKYQNTYFYWVFQFSENSNNNTIKRYWFSSITTVNSNLISFESPYMIWWMISKYHELRGLEMSCILESHKPILSDYLDLVLLHNCIDWHLGHFTLIICTFAWVVCETTPFVPVAPSRNTNEVNIYYCERIPMLHDSSENQVPIMTQIGPKSSPVNAP